MFCEKCGTQITEKDIVCPNCGNKLNDSVDIVNHDTRKCKNKKSRKTVLIASSIVLVVTIVVGAILFLNKDEEKSYNDDTKRYKSGYEGAIDHFIDFYYYYERDEKDVLAMAPEVFWQRWADHENDGDINSLFDEFETRSKLIKEKHNEELEKTMVDYQIYYTTKLSSHECQQVEKALERKHDLNYSEITNGYSFTLEITALMGDIKKEKKWDVVAVKMDGVWHLASYGNSIAWLIDKVI